MNLIKNDKSDVQYDVRVDMTPKIQYLDILPDEATPFTNNQVERIKVKKPIDTRLDKQITSNPYQDSNMISMTNNKFIQQNTKIATASESIRNVPYRNIESKERQGSFEDESRLVK